MIERSQQIESLFREASQRNLAERDTWLHEACNGDSRLLLEVTSLLTNSQEGVRGEFRKAGSATLAAGWRMGPYEILAQIGAGGMGEVYRATDTRLRREVAIKVSAAQFNERFEREARVIASLNHPNICHLYDVGPNYLVMELVEGEDLSGPVPLETALNYARQMAEALESAHEKGIVHRDLKPANVKVTPAGVVKVLDFGLAKEAGQPSAAANTAGSPTLTMSPTRVGMILGTGAYMAPEQAQGKPVDKRADVWAFGCVLYELLTGKQPFHGETTSDTLASVLRDEPDWSRIPASVQPLLRCCLMKDPMHRLRDIGDAMPLLNRVPEPIPVKPLPWVLGTVLAIARDHWGGGLVARNAPPPRGAAADPAECRSWPGCLGWHQYHGCDLPGRSSASFSSARTEWKAATRYSAARRVAIQAVVEHREWFRSTFLSRRAMAGFFRWWQVEEDLVAGRFARGALRCCQPTGRQLGRRRQYRRRSKSIGPFITGVRCRRHAAPAHHAACR
jgi:predicted Ser/Thr protein kinase